MLDYIEKNGKLPDEYDYVLTTYSQVSNGVYEFDENGARKEKKLARVRHSALLPLADKEDVMPLKTDG